MIQAETFIFSSQEVITILNDHLRKLGILDNMTNYHAKAHILANQSKSDFRVELAVSKEELD